MISFNTNTGLLLLPAYAAHKSDYIYVSQRLAYKVPVEGQFPLHPMSCSQHLHVISMHNNLIYILNIMTFCQGHLRFDCFTKRGFKVWGHQRWGEEERRGRVKSEDAQISIAQLSIHTERSSITNGLTIYCISSQVIQRGLIYCLREGEREKLLHCCDERKLDPAVAHLSAEEDSPQPCHLSRHQQCKNVSWASLLTMALAV